ncbi:VOC family protein [Sphingomonas sp. UYP23]
MIAPVVHFEIIGKNPEYLRKYYAELFGWSINDAPVADAISDQNSYGFVDLAQTPEGVGIPGGIGGGGGHTPHTIFYVSVPDVETALQDAERLGGRRVLGPVTNPNGNVVAGHFTDIEGNLVGVAGPT